MTGTVLTSTFRCLTSSSGGDGRGADTRDELKTKVADHVRDVHKVEPVTDTVMSELEKAIKEA